MQKRQDVAYTYQRAVESGEKIVVGVNRFQQADAQPIPTFRVDPALERAQVERLREVKAGRSADAVAARLADLEVAARDGRNLMPPIVEAAGVYGTVGEIADALRKVFGEYRQS